MSLPTAFLRTQSSLFSFTFSLACLQESASSRLDCSAKAVRFVWYFSHHVTAEVPLLHIFGTLVAFHLVESVKEAGDCMVPGRTKEGESSLLGIVLVTHGRAGEELIRSAEMIVGPLANVVALSLLPGQDPAEFMDQLARTIDRMPPGSLVLADLFGGTPANCSAVLSRSHRISTVSGLGLPMLIEAISLRDSLSGEDLAQAVMVAARDGIRNVAQAVNGGDSESITTSSRTSDSEGER